MTPHGALSHQVEIYHSWKKELIRQIGRYRLWLQDNRLYSDDISERIHEGLRLLVEDELTIAFVGEYSRGKTELINALFFSDFGQRMLGAPLCALPSYFLTASVRKTIYCYCP